MVEFISESIVPVAGSRDVAAMAQGEPGLPAGFTWREQSLTIKRRRGQWKQSSTCGKQRYLRRHCYELLMSDGATWVVYFTRHTPRSGSARVRWFLYTRTPAAVPASS